MRLPGETTAARHLMPKKSKVNKTDEEYWPEIEDRYDLGMELRRPYEQLWLLALSFLAGDQYVLFNSTAHLLQRIEKVRGKTRLVDNILFPKWRRQVADLIKTVPEYVVIPNSEEEEDIKAANLGTKALRHVHRNQLMKKKGRLLAGWMYSVGNAYVDDRWNPRLGEIKMAEDGTLIYTGDVDLGIWSPFDVVLPVYSMGETDIHQMPWLIKARFRTLDYIKSNFPKRGGDVVAETRPTEVMGAALMRGKDRSLDSKVPGAILKELYVEPSAQFPKGLFVTGANGIVLQQADYPFNYYNMEHFKEIDIPGEFYGKSTVMVSIPQQVRWNKTNNSMDSYNDQLAKGKILAPKSSGLEVMPDDEHGEVILYKPVMGHKPEQWNLKSMPASITDTLGIVNNSLQDKFSQHEISRGTNKSDIRSGDMVGRLREQDAHGAIPSHAIFEEGMEAVMARVLKRIQKNYTEERMIKVAGRDGEYEVISFKGSDLRNNTDVSVRRQSSLPDSRIEREMIIERRFQMGFYGDPADPEVRRHVMNMLDDAMIKDIYGDVQLDEAYARWENKMLANPEGDVHLVNDYDNHQVHDKEHNHFRKRIEYQKLKIENPEMFMSLEARFNQHQSFHRAFIEQQMQQMIEQQQAMNSKGGETNAKKA